LLGCAKSNILETVTRALPGNYQMHILFLSQYFPPETEIGGIRILEIGRRLIANGHRVSVLTGLPNYPSGKLDPAYRKKAWKLAWQENRDAIQVLRVAMFPSHSKKTLPRLANYFSFLFASAVRAIFAEKPDVIVCTSPPLTIGLSAWFAAKHFKVPFVLEARDLWPEAAIALGYLQNSRIQKSAFALERFLYHKARHIVVVSQGMKTDLVGRGMARAKCSVIPNGVDTDLFTPEARSDYIENLKQSGFRVGTYLGTLSVYHGVDHALTLLEKLRPHTDIRMVFAAGGSAVHELQSAVTQRGLNNAFFLRAPSRREMPGLIASSDFCLALVKPGPFSRWLLSSKIFMYMACGRPIFALATGETARVIVAAQCGVVEEPAELGIDRLAASIAELAGGPVAQSMGRAGRLYAEQSCGWNSLSESYNLLLQNLTANVASASFPSQQQIAPAVPTATGINPLIKETHADSN
jgi:colanic acid biosynthesis glycosyl transferase WcaI